MARGVHELLAEAVAQMSPQERAAYAERLEKAARWRDRSKGGKERSGGNPENRRGGPQDGRNSGPRDSYAPPVSAGAP